MPTPLERLKRFLPAKCRCTPPPAPAGLAAASGGGSSEVMLTWNPVTEAQWYRVYRRKTAGTWWQLAVVTPDALGTLAPGKLGIVDAPDYWPWPTGADPSAERCYAVSAVSADGLEGPMSAVACGTPT